MQLVAGSVDFHPQFQQSWFQARLERPEKFPPPDQPPARWRQADAGRVGDHGHRADRAGGCRDDGQRRACSNWIVRLGLTFW